MSNIDLYKLVEEMVDYQVRLNNSTNGKSWLEGITKNGKEIDWWRCIYMEGMELIDSIPWKHWKSINSKIDIENIKTELVDILHFIISQTYLEKGELSKNILTTYLNKVDYFLMISPLEEDYTNFIEYSESLILNSIKRESIRSVIIDFTTLLALIEMDINELYVRYMGKNILNHFRQDNGYKDGSYIKIWNGIEDNRFVENYLKEINYQPDKIGGLYSYLKESYKAIHNR